MDQKGKLFIVSGPSGVGKTTLINKLLMAFNPNILSRVVTYTSRPARKSDIAGIDYHFITSQDFERRIQEGFFIEWSGEYGHYYGSAWQSIENLDKGYSYLLILDRMGTQCVLSKIPATTIAILPPSLEVLQKRLLSRGSESSESIIYRLALAQKEMEAEKIESIYNYYVVNTFFDEAVNNLSKIITSEIQKTPLV